MFLSFANSTHQHVEHISILLTIFYSLVFLFVFLPVVLATDENRMHLSPFHSHKMNLRDTTGLYWRFQERGESVNF